MRRVHRAAEDADGHAAVVAERELAVAGQNDGTRMAGHGVLDHVAGDVDVGDDQGDEGLARQLLEHRRVEAGERLSGRFLLGVGAQHVAHDRRLGRRRQALAADVADDDHQPVLPQADEVVEVAAHPRRLGRGPVADADVDAGDRRRLHEQGLLEGLGDVVLALEHGRVVQAGAELGAASVAASSWSSSPKRPRRLSSMTSAATCGGLSLSTGPRGGRRRPACDGGEHALRGEQAVGRLPPSAA